DATEAEVERFADGAHEQRLAEARDALEQGVAAGQQAGEHAAHHFGLADDDVADLFLDGACGLDEAVRRRAGGWGGRRRGRRLLDVAWEHHQALAPRLRIQPVASLRPRATAPRGYRIIPAPRSEHARLTLARAPQRGRGFAIVAACALLALLLLLVKRA